MSWLKNYKKDGVTKAQRFQGAAGGGVVEGVLSSMVAKSHMRLTNINLKVIKSK